MLDEMDDDEIFIINQGALGFRAFETNPNGVGNLKQLKENLNSINYRDLVDDKIISKINKK